MSRWGRLVWGACLGGLLLIWSAGVARADEPEAADDAGRRTRARELAEQGDKLFLAGRCDQAIPVWQQAGTAFRAPTIELRIAHCYAMLGKVVLASRTLESIAAERLPEDAPAAFHEAQLQAVAEYPGVRARVATLHVVVNASGHAVVPVVEVDELELSRGQSVVELDPGTHRVRVRAGQSVWEQRVTMGDGARQTVRATLALDVPPEPARTQRTVGLVIGGVGIATAAVGSYFGVRALSKSNELKDICGPRLDDCPGDRGGDIDLVKRYSRIADYTMGAGAVLFLTGAAVIVTESPPKREQPRIRVVPMGAGGAIEGVF